MTANQLAIKHAIRVGLIVLRGAPPLIGAALYSAWIGGQVRFGEDTMRTRDRKADRHRRAAERLGLTREEYERLLDSALHPSHLCRLVPGLGVEEYERIVKERGRCGARRPRSEILRRQRECQRRIRLRRRLQAAAA